jgi:hypothetical protein
MSNFLERRGRLFEGKVSGIVGFEAKRWLDGQFNS